MEFVVYNTQGKEVKKLDLDSKVFSIEGKDQVIYDKIKNELANRRVGTACTKTRGLVSGGGKKPWKQKGSGRARAGSNRSPVWVGGGTVFGPQPRSYNYSLPKKIKRLAIAATLSRKITQGVVSVVEDFKVPTGKTKDALVILKQFYKENQHRVLLIHPGDDPILKQSIRNIPWLRFISSQRLISHEIFYAQNIIIMEGALNEIASQYSFIKDSNNG